VVSSLRLPSYPPGTQPGAVQTSYAVACATAGQLAAYGCSTTKVSNAVDVLLNSSSARVIMVDGLRVARLQPAFSLY
jgi:hypothetical protein